MKLSEMLPLYRAAAAPNMIDVAEEFQALSPSEQRELLFWMVVDASTNPTNVRSEHVKPAGTA
jgi:hypothetical protein